jgi:hypothetical protein
MNFWDRLSRKYFGPRSKSLEAQLALTECYRRVFLGNPSRADQQVVLADLAAQTGWNQITPVSVASDGLRFNEGKRAAFELIHRHLALSDQDVSALENAVKHEAQARMDFGLNSDAT